MPVSAPTVLPPVTDPSTAWLVVDDIALRYGKRTILEHLSFALPQGGIACLLGPSGCGKTTALRAIAGFEPISDGAIRLAGQVLSAPGQITPPEKRRIGMVFQDYALFPHLTVAQNVGFGLRGRAGADQRVALARALAPQPSILLLDEPFSNLDVELRERLAGEVRDILKATNTTAVLVTHDQHEAFAMADVIGVMADGHLQQWDTAYGLYHQPANRRVANFVGQGAFVPAVVVDEHHLRLDVGQSTGDQTVFATDDVMTHAPGTRVDVLMRPDDVVHDDASPVKARVLHKAFKGAEFLYTLALSDGTEVLSAIPSHHDHAIGEAIGIRLDLSHVVAFAHVAE